MIIVLLLFFTFNKIIFMQKIYTIGYIINILFFLKVINKKIQWPFKQIIKEKGKNTQKFLIK